MLNVLGMSDNLPRMDPFRLDLSSGDVVVIGNLALAPECFTLAMGVSDPDELISKLADAMEQRFPSAPATVGVVQVR